ncbi:hypothetical protein [Massilia sp. ST3]|uniref:hypothetical protein n=1 Tax=Massilia sp. ST3 TaxID=2824903 RepID=UPI001B83B420|nr:hypothetical protein [Massilia sp. ST3]MBQ5948698.1 hypothetical protein [Massilia sp. ST3]
MAMRIALAVCKRYHRPASPVIDLSAAMIKMIGIRLMGDNLDLDPAAAGKKRRRRRGEHE